MNFTEKYHEYLSAVEQMLSEVAEGMEFSPAVLTESMRYSLLAGGKRIRPVLFFAGLDAFGLDYLQEKSLAAAIECIHTYSLIHDDLPAMDNDDFRRGKPSCHKVFGEDNAILAGDALLNLAFELCLTAKMDEGHLSAVKRLISAAGADGMIAGQSADILWSGRRGGEGELLFIYRHKTGRLLSAPLEMAAILGGGNAEAVGSFGMDLGTLFQITDDLLDEKGSERRMGKTLGKDRLEDKLTCVKVLGLKRSEELADDYAARSMREIDVFPKNREFFEGIISLVRNRDH